MLVCLIRLYVCISNIIKYYISMCSLLQRISLDYQQEGHGVSAFKDMSKRKFVSNCCSIFGSSYNSLLLCRGSANKY